MWWDSTEEEQNLIRSWFVEMNYLLHDGIQEQE
jgi:hypothetical protein